MMVDVSKLMTRQEVATRYNVHVDTPKRWAERGVMARDGRRVTLKTIRVGGRVCIDPADLDAFMAALNGDQG
jgi:excisionase family DNA binding protein